MEYFTLMIKVRVVNSTPCKVCMSVQVTVGVLAVTMCAIVTPTHVTQSAKSRHLTVIVQS